MIYKVIPEEDLLTARRKVASEKTIGRREG